MVLLLSLMAAAAGLWTWFHQTPRPARTLSQPPASTEVVQPPKVAPANAPHMVTLGNQPVRVSRSAADWTAVQMILDTQAAYEQRIKAIASLSGISPSPSEWKALQQFLLQPDPLDRDQLGQVIKNRLMDVLCEVYPPPEGLGNILVQIYRDSQQNEVVRDYAVQHLGAYFEQISAQPDSAVAQQTAQDVLWEAANETSDSVGGTALLALKRLSQESSGIDQGKVAATALQMAQDNNAGELTHITAYQVCASLGVGDALPAILAAAQEANSKPEQISAIAALGALGGAGQEPFLAGLVQGNDDRLRLPAQHALEQIKQRLR